MAYDYNHIYNHSNSLNNTTVINKNTDMMYHHALNNSLNVIDDNKIDNANNKNNDTNNNNNNGGTPRKVQFTQFTIHPKANNDVYNTSAKSLPNITPLNHLESLPYKPQLNDNNNNNNIPDALSVDISNNPYYIAPPSQMNNHNNNGVPNLSLMEKNRSIKVESRPQMNTANSIPIPCLNNNSDNNSVSNPDTYDDVDMDDDQSQLLIYNIIPPPIPPHLTNNRSNKQQLMNNISNVIPSNDDPQPLSLLNPQSIVLNINNVSNIIPLNDNDNDNNTITPLEDDHDIYTDAPLPITHFDNSNHTTAVFNPYSQQYSRQDTLSNASYDNLPQLYSPNSHTNQMQAPVPPLPNTSSIVLPNNSKTKNKMLLKKHFSNDIRAYDTWMACCDINDDTFAYYSALYPLLCEIFVEDTKCKRVPNQHELQCVILQHGASKLDISLLDGTKFSGTHITPPLTPPDMNNDDDLAKVSGISSSDNNQYAFKFPSRKYFITIKHRFYMKFWKWFLSCCHIISELKHLWDTSSNTILQCNLFCQRQECEKLLDQAPQGTFMLRLSSCIRGGIVLSYCEPSYKRNKSDKHFKHTILIRRKQNEYEIKSKIKKNKQSKSSLTTISSVVRSFVKIKFLYTPNNLYPKKSVF